MTCPGKTRKEREISVPCKHSQQNVISSPSSTTEAATANTQEKTNSESGSVSNIFDWAKDAFSSAKDSVANVVENVTISTEELVQKVENSLNHFIEAVAVMIITSCVIPMLVLLLFFWMVKIVLDVDLSGIKIRGMQIGRAHV